MSKIVYLPYRTVRHKTWQAVRKRIPKKQRKRHKDDAMTAAIGRVLLGVPGMMATLETNVLVDEEAYIENGSRMYFPESPAMLEMLWRAKMKVGLEDLDMSLIPPAFSVAWPRCEIEGAELHGCLVAIMTGHQYNDLCKRFGKKYLGREAERHKLTGRTSDDVPGLHISYWGDVINGEPMLVRTAVPGTFLTKCLQSEGDYSEYMDSFGKFHLLGTIDLDEKDRYQNYVMAKLIIHMLVYMQACPDQVHHGIPDGHKHREFSGPYDSISPTRVRAPVSLQGTHASPSVHWRSWHFRSYPRRKDGTKRKGAIKIAGTLVNAEGVDPETVEDEALRARIEARS